MGFKDIFISYGRRESLAFVGRLHQELLLSGHDSWFDKVNIPDGDDYAMRITDGIESAHNFIYVMAPRAMTSPYCLVELEYARILGKRVIPMNQTVIFNTDTAPISAEDLDMLAGFYRLHGLPNPQLKTKQDVLNRTHLLIGRTDWLDAKEILTDHDCEAMAAWAKQYENYWDRHEDPTYLKTVEIPPFGTSVDPLEAVIESLLVVIDRQRTYVEKHTELLASAFDWHRNHRQTDRLLVGKERQQAEEWLLTEFSGGKQPPCAPSDLHCDFICAARKNAENLMTDVFICYDVEDKHIRDKVIRSLSRHVITTWVHDKDIAKGADYGKAIDEGIEKADNFFFFISPKSVKSVYCLKELRHALSYQKRIVPLLIEDTPIEDFPPEIKQLQYIDFTDNQDQIDFDSDIDEILNILNQDKGYLEEHKMMLARALQWEKEGKKVSYLLRGFNLENARTWLRLNENRETYAPTAIHSEFIMASEAAKGQLGTEVFISYSRKDADFARLLNRKLQEAGKTTWFDQESISTGVDFEKEIFKGIESSDNFVFLISPDSVTSEYCEVEVKHAALHSKRIITLLWRQTDPALLPEALRNINWIDFHKQGVEKGFQELVQALELDRDHARMHTILQQRSTEWAENDKSPDFLLNVPACAKAENWLEAGKNKQPLATTIQQEFITESRNAILLAEVIEIKRKKRLKRFLMFAVIGLLLAVAGGALALYKGIEAGEQASRALRLLKEAREARDHAIIAQKKAEQSEKAQKQAEISREYAMQAEMQSRQSMMMALQALKEKEVSLEHALNDALQAKDSAGKALAIATLESNRAKVLMKAANVRGLTEDERYTAALFLAQNAYNQGQEYWETSPQIVQQALFDAWNKSTHYQVGMIDTGIALENMAISPDGKHIAVGGTTSGNILIYTTQGQLKHTLSGHNDAVRAVAFSTDGRKLMTAGQDYAFRVWDVETGTMVLANSELSNWPQDVAFIPGTENMVVTEGNIATVRDAEGNTLFTLSGHEEPIWAVDVSPDGSRIVTGSVDGFATIWNAQTGEVIKDLNCNSEVRDIAYSPDGAFIATGSTNAIVNIWSAEGEYLRQFKGHKYGILSVAFSADSKTIISGSMDNTATVFNAETLFETHRLKGHSSNVYGVAIDDANHLFYTASTDGKVLIWKKKPQYWFSGHNGGKIYDIAVSSGSEYFYTASSDKTAREWDFEGYYYTEFTGSHTGLIIAVALSPNNGTLVTGSYDNTAVIWNTDGTPLHTLSGHTNAVYDVAASPDGIHLLTGSADKTAILWNYQGERLLTIEGQHNQSVWDVAFSRSGNEFATGSIDQTVKIWKLDGTLQTTIYNTGGNVTAVTFSPDDQWILVGGDDQKIRLYNRNGELIRTYLGHKGPVHDLDFSPDGQQFVSASEDKTAILWSFEGDILMQLLRHTDVLRTVKFTPDGSSIITASDDGNYMIWETIPTIFEHLKQNPIRFMSAEELRNMGL